MDPFWEDVYAGSLEDDHPEDHDHDPFPYSYDPYYDLRY